MVEGGQSKADLSLDGPALPALSTPSSHWCITTPAYHKMMKCHLRASLAGAAIGDIRGGESRLVCACSASVAGCDLRKMPADQPIVYLELFYFMLLFNL